jgi:hypothetical protein
METSTNFYASNLELGSIRPVFIHQLGRSRRIIDSEVFQTMTTEGHLKEPSVHQGRGQALVALTCIRVLAFTLTLVFFHRQVRSHFRNCSLGLGDLARRMAYGVSSSTSGFQLNVPAFSFMKIILRPSWVPPLLFSSHPPPALL